MSAAIAHEFADLEYQDTVDGLRRELDYCQPFDSREHVLSFCADMSGHKETAKGQGISPILWTIAMRGCMSDKQYRAARRFLGYDVRYWRTIQLLIVGDDDGVRYGMEQGYLDRDESAE